jgi:hypothetical protein
MSSSFTPAWQRQRNQDMATIQPALLQKLKQLTPQRLAEVEDFVEFLSQQDERRAAGERLGKALSKLDDPFSGGR